MRSAPRAQCPGDKPSVRSANVRRGPRQQLARAAAPIDINRSSTRLIAPPVNTKEDPDSEGGGEEKTGREVGCRALLSRARYVAGETQSVVGVSPGQPEVTTTSERVFGTDHSEGFDRIADEPSGRVACDSVDIGYTGSRVGRNSDGGGKIGSASRAHQRSVGAVPPDLHRPVDETVPVHGHPLASVPPGRAQEDVGLGAAGPCHSRSRHAEGDDRQDRQY